MTNANAGTAAAAIERARVLNRMYDTMPAQLRSKIAVQFVLAIDAGCDLYNPRTLHSPAGDRVVQWANAEAARLGFSPEATAALRYNVRAVGRRLILDTLNAVIR